MENFEPKNIKGAGDFLPATQIMRNRIIDTLKRNFESYGFLPLETAMLNYYDLLSYKYESSAEILREIYKLRDQGDRELGLRFDLTVPFCKVIAMNRNLRLPFKRYEIGKVFRNGPVKLGRTREFYQCDIDCVGVAGSHIETEIISLAVKCYMQIGIEPSIHIGNRKLLSAIIKEVGVEKAQIEAVISILDKIAKVSKEEILSELNKHMQKDMAHKLFNCISMNIENLEKQFAYSTPVAAALVEVKELWTNLGESAKYCIFTPHLARGLNIYTGTVWEVFDKKGRIPSSLGGGGRYDNIITNFIDNGQKYPAVGMSFGLEPICAVMDIDKTNTFKAIDLMLIPMQTETYSQTLAQLWRDSGFKVLVYLGGKSVGKAFEYANAESIPFVAVVGSNEIEKQEITIKQMSTGTQETFKTNETKKIIEFLGGN